MFKPLTLTDCTIAVLPMEEDIPIRGNAMSSGDDNFDKKVEDDIIRRYNAGNIWAWCCVKVTVSYDGIEEWDTLGGCSYKNERDFVKNSGYYEDMIKLCLKALNTRLEKIYNALSSN